MCLPKSGTANLTNKPILAIAGDKNNMFFDPFLLLSVDLEKWSKNNYFCIHNIGCAYMSALFLSPTMANLCLVMPRYGKLMPIYGKLMPRYVKVMSRCGKVMQRYGKVMSRYGKAVPFYIKIWPFIVKYDQDMPSHLDLSVGMGRIC